MVKVRVLAVSALLLASRAQSQTVHGVVVADSARTPIAGVLVELAAPGASPAHRARTDSTGAFLLRPRRSGTFVVRLTHPSYEPMDSATVTVGPGEAVRVQLRMGRTPIPLAPLLVTTRRNARLRGFHARMRQPGSGHFITRADIETRPGARTTDLLRQISSVEVVPVGRSRGAATVKLITMRGGLGRCQPTIYLDGMPVRQFAESGVDDFLKPEMIEGVEVYTRAADVPAEFVAPNPCGAVGFWTRSETDGENRKMSWKRLATGAGVFFLMVVLPRLADR